MKTLNYLFKNALRLILPALIVAGCSSTGKISSPSAELIRYKFNDNQTYTYHQSSTMIQTINYMGQEMGATVTSEMGFDIIPVKTLDGVTDLEIIIDTLGVSVKSIQGNMSSPIDLRGKKFNIRLSDRGKESNLEEAAKIRYSVAGQEANLKPTFALLFPDLPAEGVVNGYTWTQVDTVDQSTGSESATMIITSNNTVSGRETINGLDCYVITTVLKGLRDSYSDTPEGGVSVAGDITGSGTLYFAPAEGMFVKDNTKIRMEGSVMIPTGESLPMTVESEYTTELVRK